MKKRKSPAKLEKTWLFWLVQMLAIAGLSCQNQAPDAGRSEGTSSDKQVAAQNISEADQLYRQREDLSKVRQGVAFLRQARVADFGSYEAAWKLAKFDYYLGAHSTDDDERETAFREGIEAGKAAVQLGGDRPDGHFWLGANYGGSAEDSVVAGLANVEDIQREMEAVLKIDEGYQAGSAYLGLGQLYLQAPGILGGDQQKAIAYLEKGLKFGHNNALLRLRLAEAYYAANRVGDARRQIDFILKMTPDPDYVAEQKEAANESKKLLEKMDRN
jgi:hypothetical protein